MDDLLRYGDKWIKLYKGEPIRLFFDGAHYDSLIPASKNEPKPMLISPDGLGDDDAMPFNIP